MAKPDLRDNRKFLKLKRLLGEPTPHVIGYLECLWLRGYQTGNPLIGDDLDVEAAAEYPGEPGKFAHAAHQAGFLDQSDSGFLIHDLYDHAPKYVKMRMRRNGFAPEHSCRDCGETDTDAPDRGTDVPGFRESGCAPHPDSRTKTENQEPKASESAGEPLPARSRFDPPTVDAVKAYCDEIGSPIDPVHFVDYYEARGWRLKDGVLMKSWKAAVRTWGRNEKKSPRARSPTADRGIGILQQAHEAAQRPPEDPK